ncbi:MAG: carboxymuconolactone decarboxylase family protein [Burkholderiaceae bacterium]|nr:carboxymuconolactone decarboxylase family protein [Burkholderiaceae bacterium]
MSDIPRHTAHTPHISWPAFEQAVPGAVAALRNLAQAVESAGLDKKLSELLKVRVSQINGCAFCLQLHLDWARKAGVSPLQLDLLPTWREVSCFDARERAALAWAEALTRMAQAPIDDALHATVASHFSTTELAALTGAIANINAWNRIAGALRFTPPGLEHAAAA